MGRPPRIRREQILESARRVFAAKGFDAATLADIAGEIGVTPAAILRHVDSKAALFSEAMQSGGLIDPPACVLELANIDPATDPRIVLRRLAQEVVPFISSIITTRIVVATYESARRTSLVLPFNAEEENPPKKAFRLLTNYMRRAAKAGVLHVRDPRAAALLFMGSLQGYVLFHYVLKVEPIFPLAGYVDALIDLWSEGAIVGGIDARRKETKTDASNRDRADRDRNRSSRPAAVSARKPKARRDRAQRSPRSADGQRRVAGRRARNKDADR
ncbi:MAG TPA: TetR/AcrR family transcriptional regulator [Thermoanaerobaculia bacterium]|nr:TetR/AcrR family transcriptional regulator [Thermoanaerobaculia bacterium]